MSERIMLPGVFPRGPYADQSTAERIKEARRKTLSEHNMTMHGSIPTCQTCGAMEDSLTRPCPKGHKNTSAESILARYPSLVAHIIAESLGYATPLMAAVILRDAHEKKENWCEWIYSCYNKDPRKMLKHCVANRKHHQGYMSDYRTALVLVMRALCGQTEPLLASWW